jgi:hypothetical protein
VRQSFGLLLDAQRFLRQARVKWVFGLVGLGTTGSWTRQYQTSKMMTRLSPRKVIAIGVSPDKPAVDPERHIALLK